MATTQSMRIKDADLKEELVSLLDDYERLSASPKGETQSLRAKLRQVDEVVLTDGERSQIVAILRASKGVAGSLYAGKVDRLLLRMGDSESISNAVRAVSEGSPMQRLRVPEKLAQSKQPAVIRELAADLLFDEPIQSQLVGGSIRISPRSVSAMYIINQILAESDQFPSDVNAWAQSLNAVNVGKRRELIRSWWDANQEAMQKGDSMSTRPLSDLEQDLQRTDLKPQRRPVRRID